MKLKWVYQPTEFAKAWRYYQAVAASGDLYQIEAKWSEVYEGLVSSYRVFFTPAGGDYNDRREIGREKYLRDAKALAEQAVTV